MQIHTNARTNKYAGADLESIDFDRMMQSNIFILILAGHHITTDENLVVFVHPLTPGVSSIYIYLHGRFIHRVSQVLAYITDIYGSVQKQGLRKSPVLCDSILYISVQNMLCVPAICISLSEARRSRDLGNARDLKDGGIEARWKKK